MSLDKIYVKSTHRPDGAAQRLSRRCKTVTAPLAIMHEGQFPAVTLSFNLRPGSSLGRRGERDPESAGRRSACPTPSQTTFSGSAAEFRSSLQSEPFLILAAIVVIYIVLGVLYESYIHPITILSTLPSAGVGALLALSSAASISRSSR